MRLKIDWASLVVGSKFTFFALFYFVFEGNFPSTSDWRGESTKDFLRYPFGGLVLEGLIFGFLRTFTVLRRQHCFSFCDEKMNYKCFFLEIMEVCSRKSGTGLRLCRGS